MTIHTLAGVFSTSAKQLTTEKGRTVKHHCSGKAQFLENWNLKRWTSSAPIQPLSEVICEHQGVANTSQLWTWHHPVGVERLHAGDDPVVGGSRTVAALRGCKALERLTGHILCQRWDAATNTHTDVFTSLPLQATALWVEQVGPYVQSSGAGPGWGGATGSTGMGGGK